MGPVGHTNSIDRFLCLSSIVLIYMFWSPLCFSPVMASERYLDKSIELLKKANELKADKDFKYQLAKAFYLKGQYSEALTTLPKSNRNYYVSELHSQILSDSGKYQESNEILLKLIKYRKKDYLFRRIAVRNLQCLLFPLRWQTQQQERRSRNLFRRLPCVSFRYSVVDSAMRAGYSIAYRTLVHQWLFQDCCFFCTDIFNISALNTGIAKHF